MKKYFAAVLAVFLILGSIVPATSFATSEKTVLISADESQETCEDLNLIQPAGEIALFSNQTTAGGSKYSLVSRKVVNLNHTGTNLAYKALMAGGLASVPMGSAVARAMTTTFFSGLVKSYKYMRQSIYKRSDKKYHYYKVIDEFTNNKKTWKGPVQVSYQKVRR
ncbi:hypothetical protein [Listeria kieliensis]|uniref:hypothetical protein n=1 Tax=Listeria kieliensis TaxID=1621700 RepID=UPI000E20EEA8|nr:hypothetical protein [Listeria kieliensis]